MCKASVRVRNLYKTFSYNNHKKQIVEAIKSYENGQGRTDIYKKSSVFIANANISLDVYENEILVIMGMSGCGKSTFVRCLNGIYKIDSGSILVDNIEMNDINQKDLSALRKDKFAMVFQNFGLFPHMNVLRNVTYGLEVKNVPKEIRIQRAFDILKLVGLEDSKYKYINELSGGMKQRVGIARALVVNPDILLMDEAFSALDPLIRGEMQGELLRLVDKLKKTVVFITHDLIEAFKLGHRIAFMKDGEIVQVGKPLEILRDPKTDFIANFINNLSVLNILKIKDIIRMDFAFKDEPNRFNIILEKEGDNFSLYNLSIGKKYSNVISLILELDDEIKSVVKYLNKMDYLIIIEEQGDIIGYIDLGEIASLLAR
ncbi:Glycine betaine/proline betaine transport system ATP-binding protein ProV [Borrelia miyamotoi]|uniref:ATP-binding cassette domain-containing protein n=1 Tax=Borrelia miyamotoi TaxID=47466 RepID=A0AAP8YVZ6_9SPIR|nr:ATP-binding cassette domain-containing protein [Borrelia miyamotoi]AHH05271.1 Glycine betaine transport ATP-binding protein [Borrelia miyamotoi FR64b]ATQ15038.1 ATP-binding cassette domain-containing protein [Borrelia miyamotoi]ATQ16221.1 ATP-binding cassette domain-containing protein [Borrelia miyamotoi]ATQ17366.1 ATP-binding cassette domain-containing protein [Borrelia miyamotoi]ATQ18132.1 ATP-binding cassette domain-containing protein [Borrelia miyamotoi]